MNFKERLRQALNKPTRYPDGGARARARAAEAARKAAENAAREKAAREETIVRSTTNSGGRDKAADGGYIQNAGGGDQVVYGARHSQGGVLRDSETELEGGGFDSSGNPKPGEVITTIYDDGGNPQEFYMSHKNGIAQQYLAEKAANGGVLSQRRKQTYALMNERANPEGHPEDIAANGGWSMGALSAAKKININRGAISEGGGAIEHMGDSSRGALGYSSRGALGESGRGALGETNRWGYGALEAVEDGGMKKYFMGGRPGGGMNQFEDARVQQGLDVAIDRRSGYTAEDGGIKKFDLGGTLADVFTGNVSEAFTGHSLSEYIGDGRKSEFAKVEGTAHEGAGKAVSRIWPAAGKFVNAKDFIRTGNLWGWQTPWKGLENESFIKDNLIGHPDNDYWNETGNLGDNPYTVEDGGMKKYFMGGIPSIQDRTFDRSRRRKSGYRLENGGWDKFEKSKVGKFIDAKGLRQEKDFWMELFGYEPGKEEKDAVLDAAAIMNPAPDFIHSISKAKEGNYTDAALYAGFGLLPFTAKPLVEGTKKGFNLLKKSWANPLSGWKGMGPTKQATTKAYKAVKTTREGTKKVIDNKKTIIVDGKKVKNPNFGKVTIVKTGGNVSGVTGKPGNYTGTPTVTPMVETIPGGPRTGGERLLNVGKNILNIGKKATIAIPAYQFGKYAITGEGPEGNTQKDFRWTPENVSNLTSTSDTSAIETPSEVDTSGIVTFEPDSMIPVETPADTLEDLGTTDSIPFTPVGGTFDWEGTTWKVLNHNGDSTSYERVE